MSNRRIKILSWTVLSAAIVSPLSFVVMTYVGHTSTKVDDHTLLGILDVIFMASWIFSLGGLAVLGGGRHPMAKPMWLASILTPGFTCALSALILWSYFAPLIARNVDEHQFELETGIVVGSMVFFPVLFISFFLFLRQLLRFIHQFSHHPTAQA